MNGYLQPGDLVNVIGVAKFNTGVSFFGIIVGVYDVCMLKRSMSVYKIVYDDNIQLMDCNSRYWDFKKVGSAESEEKEK